MVPLQTPRASERQLNRPSTEQAEKPFKAEQEIPAEQAGGSRSNLSHLLKTDSGIDEG